jgi:hypothetical protein
MGQSIRRIYIGAFFEFTKEAYPLTAGDDFYNAVGEESFRYPYGGLEKTTIKIPASDDFGKTIDDYEEHVIYKLNEKHNEKLLKEKYAEQIEAIKSITGKGSFTINSGVVIYYDEIA